MSKRVHVRNGVFGMLITLGVVPLVGVMFALLIPAADQAGGSFPVLVSLLPMPILLSFQFILCYAISRRCERMTGHQTQSDEGST